MVGAGERVRLTTLEQLQAGQVGKIQKLALWGPRGLSVGLPARGLEHILKPYSYCTGESPVTCIGLSWLSEVRGMSASTPISC